MTYQAWIGQIIGDPANAVNVFNPGLNQVAVGFKVDVPVQKYPAVMNAYMNVMLINADIAVKNAADLLSDSKIGDTGCHNRSGYWVNTSLLHYIGPDGFCQMVDHIFGETPFGNMCQSLVTVRTHGYD